MSKLTDEAIHIADEISRIQPNTKVEDVIRRLVGEIHFKERYIETYRLGKGPTKSSAGGADDRTANAQPGGTPVGQGGRRTGKSSGEAG